MDWSAILMPQEASSHREPFLFKPCHPSGKMPWLKRDCRQRESMEKRNPLSCSSNPTSLPRNVVSGKPYRPEVLFLYYTNPLFSNPNPDLFSKALSEIPLIVSFSPYMDDTTSFADLILPDHTPLERWQDDPVFLNKGFPVLGIRQPVIEPLYQTKATGDVLLQISKSLGGEIQKAFPWNDFREVLLYGIRGVFDAKRGDTFGLQFEQSWTRLLERGGWWAPSYKTFEEFWKQLQEKGGWWDPVYDFKEWDRVFRTPSKKFQFYAQTLEQTLPGNLSKELKEASLFPHWEESKKGSDEKAYPFHLHIFRTMALTGSRNANQPWLQAIVGEYLFERWETWVEINPETANRIGISDRDWVWVESPKGKDKGEGKALQRSHAGCRKHPLGRRPPSRRALGRWYRGKPLSAPWRRLDPLTGYPISGSTRVKIYKAYEQGRYRIFSGVMHRWGMVIDLDRCSACQACVVACQAENNVAIIGPEAVRNGPNHSLDRTDPLY